jgi:hypothetical protein
MKEIENRKRKEEKREKNRKGPRGNGSAQQQKRPMAQLTSFPNRYPVPSIFLTDMRALAIEPTQHLQPPADNLGRNLRTRNLLPSFNSADILPDTPPLRVYKNRPDLLSCLHPFPSPSAARLPESDDAAPPQQSTTTSESGFPLHPHLCQYLSHP